MQRQEHTNCLLYPGVMGESPASAADIGAMEYATLLPLAALAAYVNGETPTAFFEAPHHSHRP